MAEKMTIEEKLFHLEGQLASLQTIVIPTIINKMSLVDRQTLKVYFGSFDINDTSPAAHKLYRLGVADGLNAVTKPIKTTEDT